MDINFKNTPKMGIYPVYDPKIFFEKSGYATFVPLWCPIFMKKFRKNWWMVYELFKDCQTAQQKDGQGWLHLTLSGKPRVQKNLSDVAFIIHLQILNKSN